MYKKIVVVLITMLVVCQAHAQEVREFLESEVSPISDSVTVQDSAEVPQIVTEPAGEPSTVSAEVYSAISTAELQQVSLLLSKLSDKMLEGEEDYPIDQKKSVPVVGNSRFAKSHYIYQTLEISTLAGKDKDDDESDADGLTGAGADGGNRGDVTEGLIKELNMGMNIGYRMIFVPGKVNGDMLEINRFGFAYSVGLLAAFDSQNSYGITCDFMLKLGVETGNGHPLGIGIDGLWGGGKSTGTYYFWDDDDFEPYYYTDWCYKYGMQVWLKTNLLTTSIKNTDILVFARYIRSLNPDDETDDDIIGILNYWNEESWQFGVTLRYRF